MKKPSEFKLCATVYNRSGWETFEIQIYLVYENHDLPSKCFAHNYIIKQTKVILSFELYIVKPVFIIGKEVDE